MGKPREATRRVTETESEHQSLPTPCCPHALSHVSSEESNGTGQGWARSPPSTPTFPPPGRIGSVTTTIADQRQQLSAPTLGDVTPRCPRAAAFGHVSVRPSIPGCPSLIFVCSCSPEICKTAWRWVQSPAWACPAHEAARQHPSRGRGEEGRPLLRKHQAPETRCLLPSHLCGQTKPTRVLRAIQPPRRTHCSNSCKEERGGRGRQDSLCPILLVGHRKEASHRFRGHSEVSRQASSSKNKKHHINRRLGGKNTASSPALPKSSLGPSMRTQRCSP